MVWKREGINRCSDQKPAWRSLVRTVAGMVESVHFTPRVPNLQNKSPPKPTQVKLPSSRDLTSLLTHPSERDVSSVCHILFLLYTRPIWYSFCTMEFLVFSRGGGCVLISLQLWMTSEPNIQRSCACAFVFQQTFPCSSGSWEYPTQVPPLLSKKL